jgi:transcriptional regulator with XRE-family HTH domain
MRFQNVGRYLKQLRLDANITQRDLASKLGMNSQFVSNWERELCAPPDAKLKAISKVLKDFAADIYINAVLKDSRDNLVKKYRKLLK